MTDREVSLIVAGAFAVLLGCLPQAGLAVTFDPVGAASERCLATAIAGRPVDVSGLVPADPQDGAQWAEGDRKARVYFGSGEASGTPAQNPVIVVSTAATKPRCKIVYRGLDRKAFHRITDRFAMQTIADGPAEGGTFDGETEVRVYSPKGTSLLLVAISVPFLKSVTVLVLTPKSFAKLKG